MRAFDPKKLIGVFHAPVGRSNHYGLGRTFLPFFYAAFTPPARTPCIDRDYDQANEARLRALHENKRSLSFQQSHIIKPIEQPKLITTPRSDTFKALRDEYHHYHLRFRGANSSEDEPRLIHTMTRKVGIKKAIDSYELRRVFSQFFRPREQLVVEQDADILKLAEQMIYLEESLSESFWTIVHLRCETMLLDCSCRYARFRI